MSNKSSTESLSPEMYMRLFSNNKEKALFHALDIRKFEIELYWKRATYFWTFISVVMAGFLTVYSSSLNNKQDVLVILSNLGLVFSVAWFNANRGSKFWQENWEKHVDMLEDDVIGPLYKLTVYRNSSVTKTDKIKDFLTGPSRFSVSKINQLISLYVAVLWALLLLHSLSDFDISADINVLHAVLVALSFSTCVSFSLLGRSYTGGHYNNVSIRKSRVKPDSEQ